MSEVPLTHESATIDAEWYGMEEAHTTDDGSLHNNFQHHPQYTANPTMLFRHAHTSVIVAISLSPIH